jgi:hypothetical protein
MGDILRHRFDLLLVFFALLAFAVVGYLKPDFMSFDKELLTAFITLTTRGIIAKSVNGNGNGNNKKVDTSQGQSTQSPPSHLE